MASVLVRQACRQLRPTRISPAVCYRRSFHLTQAVHKKKTPVAAEGLFDTPDLFGDTAGDAPETSQSAAAKGVVSDAKASTSPSAFTPQAKFPTTNGRKKKKLTPEARLERFTQLYEFVSPRIGRKPAITAPRVKKSSWVHLIGLATTEEQLGNVVEMFPRWKDSGWQFDDHIGELLARRCEELSCPLLALKVFGNYSKYNVKLTLTAGRQLLHSLHVEHPIEQTIAAAALYSVYSLPPIAHDLPSCSMLVSACFKHNSKHSLQVANALTPHLQRLLKETPPIKVSNNSSEKAMDKTKVWVKWTLKKVDKALYVQNGQQVENWLRMWRRRSEHLAGPNKL